VSDSEFIVDCEVEACGMWKLIIEQDDIADAWVSDAAK
jgi:hypothetical protein